MEYTAEVLDRSSGDLQHVSLGDWITVTEYGAKKGVGPRRVRAVLAHLGLLVDETEHAASGSRAVIRRRISQDAVKAGLGKRVYPRKPGAYPFDVLSPEGQRWIDDRWDDALRSIRLEIGSNPVFVAGMADLEEFRSRRTMTTQMEVCFLLDRHSGLSHVDIGRITGASKPLVSKYASIREDRRRHLKAKREVKLDWLRINPERGEILPCRYEERSPLWQLKDFAMFGAEPG